MASQSQSDSIAAATTAVEQSSGQILAHNDPELPTYESLDGTTNLIQPQTIHLDGVLVFPSEPPATALYQLSRDLIAGTRISIERIDHEVYAPSANNPRPRIKDRLIYGFEHQIFDDSSIEIIGKRKECFGSVLMVKTSTIKQESWMLCLRTDREARVLECVRTRRFSFSNVNRVYDWRDADGNVLAVEQSSIPTSTATGYIVQSPRLEIVVPLQQRLFDLLVTAWCARIWNQNLKTTGQIRTISKARNASFKD